MFGRSTASFDRLVEKATSQLLLEPDWDAILQICDSIRQGDVQPKYAVNAIKRKIQSDNPHVSLFGLQVLESTVKNCGSTVHQEITTKEFMEFLKDLIKGSSDPVKEKILELIQIWSQAFRNDPSCKAVQDTYHLMKMEGYTFPYLKEADAMFVAEKAPEWKDGDVCHRCRVQFSMVQRKHHCRNCGQVFCNKCSSKNSIIPKYGIEREVRVCEACFDVLNKPTGKKSSEEDLPPEYLASPLSQQSQAPPSRSEQELQEEEELQLAIALSKSEAESKEKDKDKRKSNYSTYSSITKTEGPTSTPMSYSQPTVVPAMIDTSDMDPELARYLNRNYWEQKHIEQKVSTTTPSAPTAISEPKTTNVKVTEKFQNGEVDGDDEEQFLNALKSSIEIFVNRMKSNSMRGRSIANDSSVQTLFMTINAMHPQLMKYISQQEDLRAHFEGLQDKLAQIRDAREALDSLRDEHREKRRREAEELERQRQIQMAHKLEIMRQKKQEYLEYQRQLALQRMQEQEREMQMRLEQQKHMQQIRAMQQYGYPQAMPPQMYGQPQPVQTFSPAGSAEGSPLHRPPGPMPGPYGTMPPQQQMPPPHMGMPPQGVPPQQMGAPAQGVPQQQMGAPAQGVPPQQMGAPAQGVPPQQMGAPAQPAYPQGVPPGPGQPPAGYQPPPQAVGYQAPITTYQQPGYQPPPANAQAPPQGYAPGPAMDYGAYNMQNMANALPPQGQQQPPPPQGQGYGIPPQGAYHQPPVQAPPQGVPPQGVQPQQGAPPPPQQQPPPTEEQLISFD